MASVRIIYGTTSGNTELVAEKVCEILTKKGHETTIARVEQSQLSDMDQPDVIILAASTYGHGVLQDYMIPFVQQMEKEKYDFGGRPCAVIGLGDPKYDAQYHIESANILEDVIKKHNGQLLEPSLRVSKTPVWHLDGYITKWAEDFASKL